MVRIKGKKFSAAKKKSKQVNSQIDRLINKQIIWQRNKAKEKLKITGINKITN